MTLTKIDDRGLKTPIDLLDNEKIRLGTGNDLEIYHDSLNSYVKHDGTGGLVVYAAGSGEDLFLRSADDIYIQPQAGENGIKVTGNGEVNLYHDSSNRLETTSYGVKLYNTSNTELRLSDSDQSYGNLIYNNGSNSDDVLVIGVDGGNTQNNSHIRFYVDNSEKARISTSGNLGVNTASPAGKVHANSAANTATFLAEGEVDNPSYPAYGFSGQNADNGSRGAGMYLPGDSTLAFSTAGSERFRIDAGGRIGIGTASPDKPFEIRTETASHEIFAINRPATGTAALYLGNDSSNNALISANNSNLILGKDLSGTFSEYMRIDTSGNVSVASGNLTLTSGNAVINNATGGNALTINLADAATDSIQINGGANQTTSILRMQQGNSTSGNSTGYRIARDDGTDVMNLKVDHHHNYIDLMNLKQNGHIRFFTNSSENSNGSVHVVSITSRGSIQGSGEGATRPAYAFTNDTDSGMYRRASNNIGFALQGNARYFMGGTSLGPANDNQRDLGTASLRWDDVRASNGNIVTSDKNEKNTIVASDLGLDFVNKLTPVSYKFNNKTRTHYGLIAQDVETLLGTINKSATDFAGFCKDTITTGEDDAPLDTPFDRYGLRYTEFISPIIKAIQELSAKVTALEAK